MKERKRSRKTGSVYVHRSELWWGYGLYRVTLLFDSIPEQREEDGRTSMRGQREDRKAPTRRVRTLVGRVSEEQRTYDRRVEIVS